MGTSKAKLVQIWSFHRNFHAPGLWFPTKRPKNATKKSRLTQPSHDGKLDLNLLRLSLLSFRPNQQWAANAQEKGLIQSAMIAHNQVKHSVTIVCPLSIAPVSTYFDCFYHNSLIPLSMSICPLAILYPLTKSFKMLWQHCQHLYNSPLSIHCPCVNIVRRYHNNEHWNCHWL